ncbi:hypothetical protein Ahy_A10g047724 [Arachis hypogaea]|uniref:Reverse transcriptase RNase H-like domain-containing protein n=1 Tax=Arachis hypogaea TaxID=3818 RepID=A0A445B3D1_ARAHY|nr:hypothetical protein Ahy_A10g047724 [Arachis hypogaea]
MLKEKNTFKWEQYHQAIMKKIKDVLTSTHTMTSLQPGAPLNVYLAVGEEVANGLIAQKGEDKEKFIAYVSRAMEGSEQRYSSLEKYCLSLVYISQGYRQYFQAHQVEVVSKNEGLIFLIKKPILTGRMSRWALLLSEYDVKLVTPTTIESQALAYLLSICPEKATIEELLDQISETIEIVHT